MSRLETRTDSPGATPEVPKIHVSIGEDSSGSALTPNKVLGPGIVGRGTATGPLATHGDWPFLSSPERVHEVPVVSQEHLPQLEKIQEVLTSRRDEAHFC